MNYEYSKMQSHLDGYSAFIVFYKIIENSILQPNAFIMR